MTDLHELLERATDRLESPGLASGALATARRRRRARRAAAACAAVVVLVAGVATAGRLGGDSSQEPEPAPPPTRTVEPDLVTFDPSEVDDLPPAPADLIPVLPEVLDVPTSTPSLAEDPLEAAVLTIERPDAVKVLGVDGDWRHVYPPVEGGSVELTDDGTRLLVQTTDGVDLWDVTTGEHTSVPVPPAAGSDVGWAWLDDALVVFDLGRAWSVDESTGSVGRRVDRDSLWDVGVDLGWSDPDDSLAVSVGDHRLLVRDDSRASYANGALSVQALLDDGTVLLRVLVDPGPAASVRLVAWEPSSGELWWVMQVPDLLPGWSVATDLLG